MTLAEAEAETSPFTKADEKAFEWCLSHFPFGIENPWADENAAPLQRPVKSFPPFDIEDMLGPPELIKETEIAGELVPEIAKYQGHWIWPAVSMPSPMAIFVERLTPTEMTVAMVKKKLNTEPEPHAQSSSLRHKLKWNGDAFIEEPQGPDGVGYLIRISQDGRAMFVVFVTRIEAMPGMCLLSSKHY